MLTLEKLLLVQDDFRLSADWSLPAGARAAVIGPSGAGKSTFLMALAGFLQPASGRILWQGRDLAQVAPGDRPLSILFQDQNLFPHLTVAQNLGLGLRPDLRLKPAQLWQVAGVLDRVGLGGMGARKPAQLSGGQLGRAALARVLLRARPMLLLDEPFGALDAKVRQDLRNWLRRLHEELRMTTILVTHDQEEALEVADRVVVMNRAKIEQVGSPEAVFHAPVSEFVMDFLGNVNVFHGRVENGIPVISKVHNRQRDTLKNPEEKPIYVRPHDLEISLHGTHEHFCGSVKRLHMAGSTAKVVVGSPMGDEVQVELPFERVKEMGITLGETVYLRAKQARIFAPDYQI